jgi:hypothetical protein
MRVNGIKGWPSPSLPRAPSLNCPINRAPFTVYFAPLHSSSPEATITTTQRQGSQRSTRHHHYRAVHAAALFLLLARRPHRPFFDGRSWVGSHTGDRASHGLVHVSMYHPPPGHWTMAAVRNAPTNRAPAQSPVPGQRFLAPTNSWPAKQKHACEERGEEGPSGRREYGRIGKAWKAGKAGTCSLRRVHCDLFFPF